ncbi:MAG: hypothetical protein CVU38_02260 [Chloroflexi bacterium HGW-Chloroflexi-1]|nr:MAG: hypothetical protein CVU38_02260 [Chloroflexi bacterium HGW-Chloroflexi-1]
MAALSSKTVEKHRTAWRRLQTRTTAWLSASVRRWLVFPLVVSISVLVLSSTLLGVYVIRSLLTEAQTQILLASSQIITDVFQSRIRETSRLMLQSSQFKALISGLDEDDASLVSAATTDLAHLYGVSGVALADTSGHLVFPMDPRDASAAPLTRNASATLSAPAQRAMQQMLADSQSDALIGFGKVGLENEPVFCVAEAVRGRSYGVVVVGISIRQLVQDATAASSKSYLVFYDADRSPAFTTFPPTISSLAELPVLPATDTASVDMEPPVTAAMLAGAAYRYVARPFTMDGTPLGYVAVWQPFNLVSQIAGWVGWFLLGTIWLCSGLIIILGWRLSNQVTRPVAEMAHAAWALAEGDFAVHVSETAIGELAVLGKAFNRMASQVHAHTNVLQGQASHSNYLFQASAELGRTLDLDESSHTAAEAIYGLGGLAYVVILVGRGELGPYTCGAVRGLPGEVTARMYGKDYPVPLWGVMARALVSRQPLVIDDVVAQHRPQPGEFDWDVGGSMLLFPVTGANEPSALIIVGTQEPRQLGAGSLGDMVFALARIAGHSILNAQLYQEATRSREQLVTLQMLSRVMASAPNIEAVFDVVIREASEIMGGSPAWLYIRDSEIGEEQLYGRPGMTSPELWAGVNQDAVAWVLRAGQPIFYDPEQPLAPSPILVDSGMAMCVPLEVNDDAIGALVVLSRDRRRVFIENDMVGLRTLANSAAAALQTAHLARRL